MDWAAVRGTRVRSKPVSLVHGTAAPANSPRFGSRLSVIHNARYYDFGKTGVTSMPRRELLRISCLRFLCCELVLVACSR